MLVFVDSRLTHGNILPIVEATLQSFLITARIRRQLSQQVLANIAAVNRAAVSEVERGAHDKWSPRVAAAIGLALHEVAPLTPEEVTNFCRLTGVAMSIFAHVPQHSERDLKRRSIMPAIDRLLDRYEPTAIVAFLMAVDGLMRGLKDAAIEPEPQILTHVSAPKYRPDLNATEQVYTDYAKAPKPRATPLKKKSGGA